MTSENSSNRLVALDGIRGIAIIFVILNHIPLGVLFTVLPSWTFPLLTLMTVNGKTAVSLLFLLSGFLMTWLYPQPKKAIDFWSKRYARIFPPFLVMVLSLALIRSFKLFLPVPLQIQMTLQPWIYAALSVPIVLTMAVLGRFLWKSGVALNQKLPIGKLAIWGFLAFQLGVAAWYSLILLRVPPAEFYLKWSQTSQMIATTVVNATLTFPFGNYIAQLDGVYWSLITEVAFYLLYPVLIVPLIGAVLQRKSWKYSALLFLAFLPFLFGLKLVFERVLGFHIMQIHLFVYFITGAILAIVMRKKEAWQEKALRLFPWITHPVSIPLFLAILFCSLLAYKDMPEFYHPWVQLIWSIPITIVLFIALIPQASLGKWLNNKYLALLGKYSFSLYIIHSLVIEFFTRGKVPDTLQGAVLVTIGSLVGSFVMARLMFWLIESPYFELRKAKRVPFVKSEKAEKEIEKKSIVLAQYSPIRARLAVVSLTAFTFVFVYLGYRSLASFSTLMVAHSDQPSRVIAANPVYLPISTSTKRFEFIADANNLGMITTSLKSEEVKDKDGVAHASSTPGELEIRLLDAQNAVLAKTRYKVHEIGESRYHPFGFPVIPDSKGKTFAVEYQIVQEDPARALLIEAGDAEFRTQYVTDKRQLIANPVALAEFAWNKLVEPFAKPSTRYTLVHLLPFLGLLWIGLLPLSTSSEPSKSSKKMVK